MSNKAYLDESIVRCPACGAEVWIHEVEFPDEDIWFTPRCTECNVAWAENYHTYEDAVAAWNKVWGFMELDHYMDRMKYMVRGEMQALSKLQKDVLHKTQLLKEAMGLLELAADNLPTSCENCTKQNKCPTRTGSHKYCWKWMHSARYNALKTQFLEIT